MQPFPNPDFPDEPPATQDPATSLSKRAARRIIQRAFVLMSRDKVLRQHIRDAETVTLWIVEDMQMEWTVLFHRGRFEVERRPAKHPDVTLTWATAEEFFQQVDRSAETPVQVQIDPVPERRRHWDILLRGFFSYLRQVLANPVDDVGESLL
jgi:hypothetical protein